MYNEIHHSVIIISKLLLSDKKRGFSKIKTYTCILVSSSFCVDA